MLQLFIKNLILVIVILVKKIILFHTIFHLHKIYSQ